MIRLKENAGVMINGVKPEVILALMIIESVFNSYGKETVITALTDGAHSRNSLHYVGYAVDIRSRDLTESKRADVLKELIENLGNEFDIIYEADHFHIEFQPETNRS